MKNLVSIPERMSTMGILSHILDDIEQKTGYRPSDWMKDIYSEAYDEYMDGDSFDWAGFKLHLSCVADSFIEFIDSHYQYLNMTL